MMEQWSAFFCGIEPLNEEFLCLLEKSAFPLESVSNLTSRDTLGIVEEQTNHPLKSDWL